jgi:hypothetical protein
MSAALLSVMASCFPPPAAPSGGGAKAFVQKSSVNASSGVTTQTTTLTGVTAANLLVCICTWDMNAASGNPTINASSTGWNLAVQAGPVVAAGNSGWITGTSIFYNQNASSGSNSLQLDFASTSRMRSIILEVSGNATSGSLDKTSTNTSTSATTLSTTTAATTWATEISIAANAASFVAGNANVGMTDPPTGYTSIEINQDTNTYAACEAAYLIVSSTGTQTASWTWATAGEATAAIATFK